MLVDSFYQQGNFILRLELIASVLIVFFIPYIINDIFWT